MGVGARLISQPDAVVLHASRSLIEELSHAQNLTTRALGAVDTLHEVPELGASQDGVLSEELHLEDLRDGDLLSGGRASRDLVLVHTSSQRLLLDGAERLLHHLVERMIRKGPCEVVE